MRATFCGTAQAFPDAARAGAGVLLESKGSALLLDCGPGAPVRAYEARPGLARLEAVLVSHLHFDHALGLAELLTRLAFDDRTPPPIYGPRGTAEYAASALDFARTQHRFLAGGKWLSFLDDVRVHECDGGEATELGPFTAQAATTEHAANLHALAWRVESGSASVVYSGDTSERSESIARLARSAGTLIHECYSETALERHLAGEPEQVGCLLVMGWTAPHGI